MQICVYVLQTVPNICTTSGARKIYTYIHICMYICTFVRNTKNGLTAIQPCTYCACIYACMHVFIVLYAHIENSVKRIRIESSYNAKKAKLTTYN